jgi:hypothetical protein
MAVFAEEPVEELDCPLAGRLTLAQALAAMSSR